MNANLAKNGFITNVFSGIYMRFLENVSMELRTAND